MTSPPDVIDMDLVRQHLDQMISRLNVMSASENWGFTHGSIRFSGFVLKDFEGVIQFLAEQLTSNTSESTFLQRARALELTIDACVTSNKMRKFGMPAEWLKSTTSNDKTSYSMNKPKLLVWFETYYGIHLETQKHLDQVLGHVIAPPSMPSS